MRATLALRRWLLVANILTLILLFVFRFVIADAAIHAKGGQEVDKRPMRIIVAPANLSRPAHPRYRADRLGHRHLPFRLLDRRSDRQAGEKVDLQTALATLE